MQNKDSISYFAHTNSRPPHRTFGIKQRDRLFHMYAIGKTGAGKTTLLETLAMADIRAGRGCAVIDPHGDLAARLVRNIPEARRADLIYINATDPNTPYGYNPLRRVAPRHIPLAASGLMSMFRKLWGESAWGVRMEHLLRNILYALLEYGNATLPDIARLTTDDAFRAEVLTHIKNPHIHQFWEKEFPRYTDSYKRDALAPIQNKVGAFLADPCIARMCTEPDIDLHVRALMDTGKIIILNISKGQLGEDSANLLGTLFISVIAQAAFSRANVRESERRPFFLYIDEFQDFTTGMIVNMVTELRKFGTGLILAHQHLHQLSPDIRHAVLANMGTIISFRLGPEDAPIMARHFPNLFKASDLLELPYHDIVLTLMIDGSGSRAFSATTIKSPP